MMDYDQQIQAAQLRQRDAIGRTQFQNPQGRMVSGIYVAPNPLEYLSAALRSAGAGREAMMAGQEVEQASNAKKQAVADALRTFGQMAQGTPAETLPEGQQGPTRPAQAPNMQGAYAALMQVPDAGLQQAGMQGMLSQAKAAQESAQKQQWMGILQNSTPQQAIAAGVPIEMVKAYAEAPYLGRPKVTYQDVGGEKVPVTEYGDRPQGVASLPKTGNPFSDLLVRGPDGKLVPNSPLVGAKSQVAAAGRPVTSVDARTFNTQESEQSKVYGKGLGEMRLEITRAGVEAPRKLAQMERMEQLLTGIEGGRLAPAMTDVQSALKSLGISVGKNLGAKEASEALAIEMALKMRPPGSGPMTDRDFENFLRTAPSLAKSAEGRRQIIQTVRAAVQRDIEASTFARQYAERNNGVIDDSFFQALQDFYIHNPVVMPTMPETNSRRSPLAQPPAQFNDPGKEQRYQEWLRSQGAR